MKTNRHECTQNTDPLSGPTDTTARCNNNARAESDACERTFLWAIDTQKCWCFSLLLLLFFTLNFQSIWSYGPVIMLHEWRKLWKQWVQQFGKYPTIMDVCMDEKTVSHKSVWLKSLSKKCYTQEHRGNQQAEETGLEKKNLKTYASSHLYAY